MPSKQFIIGEHVDVFKKMPPSSWVEAIIVSINNDTVTVVFPSLGEYSSTVFPIDSPDIQKRWNSSEHLSVNNRIDIKDLKTGVWCQGIVMCDRKYFATVNYEIDGIVHSDTILLPSDRISEIGTYTKGLCTKIPTVPTKLHDPKKNTMKNYLTLESKYQTDLSKNLFTLVKMEGDGNCLFRSFAQAIYGDQNLHRHVRKYCIEYLNKERNYFSHFIVGGSKAFDLYLSNMSKEGVWGDDVEIQALSELYDVTVEIYIYAAKPSKTFHESAASKKVVKLSFHYNSHYNLLYKGEREEPFIDKLKLGVLESNAIYKEPPSHHKDFYYSEKVNLNVLLASEVSAILDLLVKSDVEETKKVSDRDMTEDEIVKNVKEESMKANSTCKSDAVKMCIDMGYYEDHVMQAYSLFGEDVQAIVEYINNTIMKAYM